MRSYAVACALGAATAAIVLCLSLASSPALSLHIGAGSTQVRSVAVRAPALMSSSVRVPLGASSGAAAGSRTAQGVKTSIPQESNVLVLGSTIVGPHVAYAALLMLVGSASYVLGRSRGGTGPRGVGYGTPMMAIATTTGEKVEAEAYPIGTPGQPWGEEERAAWLAQVVIKRSYKDEVLAKLEPLKDEFDVVQYGALPYDTDRYPLFAVKSRDWSPSKPSVLVTGGVHGYETSGVQGALLFLKTKAKEYSDKFNIVVLPCVSPWGYEAIQRWNPNAEDPNRGFQDPTGREECAAAIKFVNSLGVESWTAHIDLHETTDTDSSEFCPAKAARDGVPYVEDGIPDGFYLVGNTADPQLEWHKHMIEAVRKVTHIAPADDNGNIIGEPVVQEGVILIPAKELGLCSSLTNAKYATTTEVYPDSPKATDEQCNHAQVASVTSGLDWILAHK